MADVTLSFATLQVSVGVFIFVALVTDLFMLLFACFATNTI